MFPAVRAYVCNLMSETPKFQKNIKWLVERLRQYVAHAESEAPLVMTITCAPSSMFIGSHPSSNALAITPKDTMLSHSATASSVISSSLSSSGAISVDNTSATATVAAAPDTTVSQPHSQSHSMLAESVKTERYVMVVKICVCSDA